MPKVPGLLLGGCYQSLKINLFCLPVHPPFLGLVVLLLLFLSLVPIVAQVYPLLGA
jgi:hypothetical protein